MNALLDFFKKKPQAPFFNVIETDLNGIKEHPAAITQIYEREIDGMLIADFLSQEEMDSLRQAFYKLPTDQVNEVNTGLRFFPSPFSLVDQKSEGSEAAMSEYFKLTESQWNNYEGLCSYSFKAKMEGLFNKISGGRKAVNPTGHKDQGRYAPATIKQLLPKDGTLKPHCGNYFQNEFEGVYVHLNNLSHVKNQLSYFIVLEKPEGGGELVVYDKEWRDVEVRLPDHGDNLLQDKKGKIWDLENQKQVTRTVVDPKPGDLFIFAGGEIWHKIEHIRGNRHRLSISGFMTMGRKGESLYYWS